MTESATTPQANSVIIIGAGAAGLAAAHRLNQNGYHVTILEARERIGGRVHTDYDMADHPVELGAEFIHGSGVLLWSYLRRYDLGTLPPIRDPSIYAHLHDSIDKFDTLVRDDWEEDIWECAKDWIAENESDVSLATMLRDDDMLPDDEERYRLLNHIYASDYGADLDRLGMYGLIEASYAGDGEDGDYHIRQGYSALLDKLAQTLDIRLKMPVSRVQYTNKGVTVITSQNDALSSEYAVVTLPLAVLRAGDVTFAPDLPESKHEAIQRLGIATVNKIILRFKESFWQRDMAMFYTPRDSQLWWRPGYGRDNEAPLLTMFNGGAAGERISQLTETDAVQFALDDLAAIYGDIVRDNFVEGRHINWGADPYAKMAYSYNPVYSAGLRDALAAPVTNRLYFAGEACNKIRPATVHGAMETGLDVARQIIESSL